MKVMFYLSGVKQLFFTKNSLFMKWFLLIPAMLITLNCMAQTKLPQIRMDETGWGTKFKIGDNQASKSTVFRHIEQNRNATGDAYALFLKANQQNTASWIWFSAFCIGSGLALYGSISDGPASSLAVTGYVLMGVNATGSLITAFRASDNYTKSVDTYNRFAGY